MERKGFYVQQERKVKKKKGIKEYKQKDKLLKKKLIG
jgi:hypothetical protein